MPPKKGRNGTGFYDSERGEASTVQISTMDANLTGAAMTLLTSGGARGPAARHTAWDRFFVASIASSVATRSETNPRSLFMIWTAISARTIASYELCCCSSDVISSTATG
jgi:hypothetical protein